VYTNSLLFIRSGGDSRVAGLMLAGATAILWMVGPWIVGYIPVMVVGSLIFHLGLDLLKEALVDTWNSVHYLEYITICVIIACMATLGFVEGILVGIIMACIFFVVQNARQLVQGLDFSAAEAFVRIRRLLRARQVYMIVCNVARRSDEEKALMKAGIWVKQSQQQDEGDLKCFEHINDAVEWCENVLLTTYFEKKPKHLQSKLLSRITKHQHTNSFF